MRTTPGEIAEAQKWLHEKDDSGPATWARIHVLLSATAPLTNEELVGIMADYCVDVLKVETDRAQIVASYMRDMESSDGHSYGRMARYLADRLFGKVRT